MRQLTAKQKKVLKNWTENTPNFAVQWEDLPSALVETLVTINDTEILWCETERYLRDIQVNKLYGRN